MIFANKLRKRKGLEKVYEIPKGNGRVDCRTKNSNETKDNEVSKIHLLKYIRMQMAIVFLPKMNGICKEVGKLKLFW